MFFVDSIIEFFVTFFPFFFLTTVFPTVRTCISRKKEFAFFSNREFLIK